MTEMLLENKNAVVYGAAGAVGSAVAEAFAREGAHVFLTGRDLARVQRLADKINDAGGHAEAAAVDALDEHAVAEHLDGVIGQAGRLDVSFNAAGLPQPGIQGIALTDLAKDAFARPIAFYTTSHFTTATAAARHMIGHGSGVIVTLTATPARMAAALVGGMAPAWAALEAFSRCLAAELGPAGIRVVCLRSHAIPETPLIEENFAMMAPAAGVTPTQFQTLLEQGTLLNRLPTLTEVADTAAFIASDRASAMTATIANLSAGSITD